MPRRNRPIKPTPKARNPWGGLTVEEPGGMERDKERRLAECRRVEREMRAMGARELEACQ